VLKILFIGDVVGFSGLDYLLGCYDQLVSKYETSFTIVNGENICDGKGLTKKEADLLFGIGVDAITTGNHV
jgi:calcineurin-like phosphoesterase